MVNKKGKDNIEKLVRSFLNAQMGNDPESREAIGRFKYWISNHHDQQTIKQVLNEVWDEERVTNSSLTEKQKREILDQMGLKSDLVTEKRSVPLRRLLMRVAVVVLPIMVFAGGYFLLNRERAQKTYEHQVAQWVVPNGDNKVEILVDSSKVWVNAGSSLSINISDTLRTIALNGEALFEVTKDSLRPFIVAVDDLKVTVLGTKFNVEAYPDQSNIIVTLAEGRVSLMTETGKEYILEPNKQLIYNKLAKTVDIIPLDDISVSLAWITGRMVCRMKTMREIFKIFERKYGIEVIVDDSQRLDKRKITATFGSEDSPDTVMDALGLTGNFKYEKKDGVYRIISVVIP